MHGYKLLGGTSQYCNFMTNENNEKINYLLVRDFGLFDTVLRHMLTYIFIFKKKIDVNTVPNALDEILIFFILK